MMAVLKDTINIIREDYGEEIDLAQLPPDDSVRLCSAAKGGHIGMFQVESRAQMSWPATAASGAFLRHCGAVAIIRPGRSSARW